eukprot:641936-Pleurochrysis_carterae.AAC.1
MRRPGTPRLMAPTVGPAYAALRNLSTAWRRPADDGSAPFFRGFGSGASCNALPIHVCSHSRATSVV